MKLRITPDPTTGLPAYLVTRDRWLLDYGGDPAPIKAMGEGVSLLIEDERGHEVCVQALYGRRHLD